MHRQGAAFLCIKDFCKIYCCFEIKRESGAAFTDHDITKCRTSTIYSLYFMYPVSFKHIQAENDNYILAAINKISIYIPFCTATIRTINIGQHKKTM